MQRSKTHFEQIPVEAVRKLATEASPEKKEVTHEKGVVAEFFREKPRPAARLRADFADKGN